MAKEILHEYNPDVVSPPGETLQDILDSLGMSQAELARRMGRPQKTINEIIKAETAIIPKTALQLEKVLNIPDSFWNNREKKYREYLARREDFGIMEEDTSWVENFPISEMNKYGWIAKTKDTLSQLNELLKFFGLASPKQWSKIWNYDDTHFRKSKVNDSKLYLLSAWLRQGEILAQNINCSEYDSSKFQKNLFGIRALTKEQPNVFVNAMQELCADSGVALVLVPELSRSGVWGATRWLTNTKALIQLSLRYKTNDHLWFTFFHEACHVLKHGKRKPFIEIDNYSDQYEDQADEFSRNFLIPKEKYEVFVSKHNYSNIAIANFAHKVGIHHGIVVGRLQHDKIIGQERLNKLKIKYRWQMD